MPPRPDSPAYAAAQADAVVIVTAVRQGLDIDAAAALAAEATDHHGPLLTMALASLVALMMGQLDGADAQLAAIGRELALEDPSPEG